MSNSVGKKPSKPRVTVASGRLPGEDDPDFEELQDFARVFKQKRAQLGFSQSDVGVALGQLYGSDFSQTTVSRFEALNLSLSNMVKLRPVLENWLIETESMGRRMETSSSISARPRFELVTPPASAATYARSGVLAESARRKRFKNHPVRHALLSQFDLNPRPSSPEVAMMSQSLGVDPEVIQIWFRNRRRRFDRSDSVGN